MESLREIELEVHKQEKLFYTSYKGVLSRPLGYSMKKLYEGQCGMRSKKEIRNLGCDKLHVRFNMIGFARDRNFYPKTHLDYMQKKCFHELEIRHSERYKFRDSPELYTKNCIPRRGIINICRVARFITTVFNIDSMTAILLELWSISVLIIRDTKVQSDLYMLLESSLQCIVLPQILLCSLNLINFRSFSVTMIYFHLIRYYCCVYDCHFLLKSLNC
ncbi:unnamed protein product [Moneuplotes crassus]|uniref:Uncharacterized protein n=1 Tax=Euplotes crassus TaxID=5936 RepID=A0AAD1UKP2_EUPCR|nr:unnamed protein product [Moneuplotes crassus]